jgi:hypothetical protein
MLATLVEGKTDLADVLFLVAMILFIVCAVIHAMAKQITGTILCAGLACVALAWLVL